MKKVHPRAESLYKTGKFSQALHFRAGKLVMMENIDKVKIAHEVVTKSADLSVLDLQARVTQIIEFIESANDFFEWH